jgi:type IV secretory pathway protease TraF
VFFAGLFFISFLKQHTMLLIAQSESLPYRYFLLIKNSAVKKGDLIAIQNHPLADISNIILTKKLIGLPGDKITLHGQIMRINQEWQGALHKQNSQGYPLTPLNVVLFQQDLCLLQARIQVPWTLVMRNLVWWKSVIF